MSESNEKEKIGQEKKDQTSLLNGTGSVELKRSNKSFEKREYPKKQRKTEEEEKCAPTIEDALSQAGVLSPHRPDELQKHIFSTQQSSGLLSPGLTKDHQHQIALLE